MVTARLTKHAQFRFEQRSGIGPIDQAEVPIFLSECRRCTNREVSLYSSQKPGNLFIHEKLQLIAVVCDGAIITFLDAARPAARDKKWKRKNKSMIRRRDRKARKRN